MKELLKKLEGCVLPYDGELYANISIHNDISHTIETVKCCASSLDHYLFSSVFSQFINIIKFDPLYLELSDTTLSNILSEYIKKLRDFRYPGGYTFNCKTALYNLQDCFVSDYSIVSLSKYPIYKFTIHFNHAELI